MLFLVLACVGAVSAPQGLNATQIWGMPVLGIPDRAAGQSTIAYTFYSGMPELSGLNKPSYVSFISYFVLSTGKAVRVKYRQDVFPPGEMTVTDVSTKTLTTNLLDGL